MIACTYLSPAPLAKPCYYWRVHCRAAAVARAGFVIVENHRKTRYFCAMAISQPMLNCLLRNACYRVTFQAQTREGVVAAVQSSLRGQHLSNSASYPPTTNAFSLYQP